MKLFGKDISLPKIFQQKTPTSKELGGTGTSVFGGMIQEEEYNSALSGKEGLTLYDQMRRSDATVGAALMSIKLPIRGAKWYVQPASEEKVDIEIADFINSCLMEKMTVTWDDFLRQALLMLDYGHMVFEKVFQIVEHDNKEYVGWKKFAPRLPKSIYKWEAGEGKEGITQQLPDGTEVQIPMEKLAVFVNQKEGDNWDGISVLRQAYKHWYYKDNFYKIDAMSFERQGLGIPVMKLPAGYDSSDKSIAESLLKNIRANEQQYLLLPFGWEFEFADMKGNTVRDPQNSILHHDRQITKSVLAQFLELGASGGSGSRALSQDHSDLFYEAEKAIARQICDVVNKYCIKQLVDMNFDVEYYPELRFTKIGKVDFEKIANALDKLITAKVVLPDGGLEDYMREQMELPDVPEDEKEEREELRKPQPEEVVNPVDGEGEENTGKPTKKEKGDMEKEENTKKTAKKASEVKKKSEVQLQGAEPVFVGWRPLTFAEKKVDFKKITDKLTEFEQNFIKDTAKILEEASPAMLESFKKSLKAKDMTAVRNLAMEYKGPYRKEILRHLGLVYEFGKRGASKEMGIAAIKTPDDDLKRLIMQADAIADMHESELVKAMKLTVLKEMKNGKTLEEAMNKVAIEIGKLTNTLTYNTAVLTMGSLFNQGRYMAQYSNRKMIYALQRSEILDMRICNFCLSMDGRIVRVTDPIAKSDIFHSNCRGIWVEIMKDEAELPEVKGVPQGLLDKYDGGVNEFEQIDKPILDKDSIAWDFYKGNLDLTAK